jgi:hypothetical protein
MQQPSELIKAIENNQANEFLKCLGKLPSVNKQDRIYIRQLFASSRWMQLSDELQNAILNAATVIPTGEFLFSDIEVKYFQDNFKRLSSEQRENQISKTSDSAMIRFILNPGHWWLLQQFLTLAPELTKNKIQEELVDNLADDVFFLVEALNQNPNLEQELIEKFKDYEQNKDMITEDELKL